MGAAFDEPPREIVGIVRDARDAGLNNDPQPQMFVPVSQVRDGVMALNNRFMPLSWVVRTNVAPFSLSAPIQRVFQDLADLPVAHVRSMDQVVVQSTARNQFNTLLLGIFAFVAILLASIGLYGLMAYAVEQRTLEFGIRLALGADSPALRNMIVRQAMLLALAGNCGGTGGGVRVDAPDGDHAVRREGDGPAGVRRGGAAAGHGGVSGELPAGAAGSANRPDGGAAVPVGRGHWMVMVWRVWVDAPDGDGLVRVVRQALTGESACPT